MNCFLLILGFDLDTALNKARRVENALNGWTEEADEPA